MPNPNPTPSVDDQFDYSTTEAEEAIRAATAVILEIREDTTTPLARKVDLYERTLGLAVVPVLLRRTFLRLWRRSRVRRS